jgi:hypothetical protein
MSYRKIIRRHATSDDTVTQRPAARTASNTLETMSYRDLQQKAIDLGISGKQTAEALREAIRNAE